MYRLALDVKRMRHLGKQEPLGERRRLRNVAGPQLPAAGPEQLPVHFIIHSKLYHHVLQLSASLL